MMFERFTGGARQVVVRAQEEARRLGHSYIGGEHLLLAAAAAEDPAGVVLRDHGVTPERVAAEIVRVTGRGPGVAPGDPLRGVDREALAAIGIDLDVVRDRIEAAFGPDALARAVVSGPRAGRARRGPALGKGPVARLRHARRVRRARRGEGPGRASRAATPLFPGRDRHLPFTPRAKKSLELSLRQSLALHDSYIGVQHLVLALLTLKDGMPQLILASLGASPDALRAAILDRYRKAS
jgi:Clp amino terminal domain, pathogenicity island component